MSASRNLEERAAACLAKFEDKIDSLVNKEKASFRNFCQSEISKLKTNNTSLEDSGIPDFDSSSVVNSTVLPPPPDLLPPGTPSTPVFPLQIYVPPPPIVARLATLSRLRSPITSPQRPVIVPVRRSHRKFRETNKFTYSPSHIKSYKPRKRKRTMSLEKVRCNLEDEFEAENVNNLSLEAEVAQMPTPSINTPTSPRSPIPIAVIQPRIASPFPVGEGEPDLFDLLVPNDLFDVPQPPSATPVPLDEISLYGEVEADDNNDLGSLNSDYVGLEEMAQLYDQVGLGMQPLSDNDDEVARINAMLDDDRPISSLSEININLDTPSTGMTSLETSVASLSEVDLTCNEEYDPNFGQVRFDDGAAAMASTPDNNNDETSYSQSTAASMLSGSTASAPPPYLPMGAFRCHQCGAINNLATTTTTTTTTWASPPPPYSAYSQSPQGAPAAAAAAPVDAPVQADVLPAAAPAANEPVVPQPVAAAVDVDLNELFSGSDQEINMIGMLPAGPNYNQMQPPENYGHQEQVPFRDLLGPADFSDEEDK